MNENTKIDIAMKLDPDTLSELEALASGLEIPKSDAVKLAIVRLHAKPALWVSPEHSENRPSVGNYNVRLNGIFAHYAETIRLSLARKLEAGYLKTGPASATAVVAKAVQVAYADYVDGSIYDTWV